MFAAGNWGFDYLALVTAVAAFDPGFPNPALILLAYVTGQVLSTISITPGGVGFVEAGLAATLVLAGVPRGSAALATLGLPARVVLAGAPGRRTGVLALAPALRQPGAQG